MIGPLGIGPRRILAVAMKEVRQIARDPVSVGLGLGVPLLQLMLFGYAINQEVRHVPTAVLDSTRSSVSRELVGELEATQTFDVVATVSTEVEGREMLERGAIAAVVVIPEDFSHDYFRGRGARVSILVDASDPIVARAVRSSANGLEKVLEERFESLRRVAGGGALMSAGPGGRFEASPDLIADRSITFAVLTQYNPELRTPVYVVPGLLGVILTQTMTLLTSLALVRERERGTFEFLIGTPVKRGELMVGKILPYVVIGYVQLFLVLLLGLLLFRIPVKGSLLDLSLGAAFFIAANLVVGLVISTVTRNQYQATQLTFFFFLPSVLLSGFMFPFASMPRPAQWLGELLPLTHFNRLARSILLRGASLSELWPSILALVVFFLIGIAASTRLFQKKLD